MWMSAMVGAAPLRMASFHFPQGSALWRSRWFSGPVAHYGNQNRAHLNLGTELSCLRSNVVELVRSSAKYKRGLLRPSCCVVDFYTKGGRLALESPVPIE